MDNQLRKVKTKDGHEVPEEFFDFLDIIDIGAKKYAPNNWLEPDGMRSSHKDMHDSIFHHIAESYSGFREDQQSGKDPLLHAACRILMLYTRKKRGIKHSNDE